MFIQSTQLLLYRCALLPSKTEVVPKTAFVTMILNVHPCHRPVITSKWFMYSGRNLFVHDWIVKSLCCKFFFDWHYFNVRGTFFLILAQKAFFFIVLFDTNRISTPPVLIFVHLDTLVIHSDLCLILNKVNTTYTRKFTRS